MEENNNRNDFDAFLRKAIKEVGVEEPSKDFNQSILSRLPLVQERSISSQPPLISNFVWFLISFGVFALIGFALLYDEETKVNGADFKFLNNLRVPNFLDFNINFVSSDVAFYGIISVLVFFYIQIFVLKKYFSMHDYALNQYIK
ncbi:hypothetical protein [Cellulophaga sp. L1A9]|uniref:hypothetical protein n=1 Tax=Cellulophaga sp. L1A9 TaxID=2686362 RepID=UPI00131C9F59|nr:hypothetical protein [Cellulophaga sp. L1A9]